MTTATGPRWPAWSPADGSAVAMVLVLDLAIVLAAHAAVALTAVDAERHTAHLRRALHTRDVIGQAKGILMARRGVSPDEAFEVLRQTSQRTKTKLVEVAELLTQAPGHASSTLAAHD